MSNHKVMDAVLKRLFRDDAFREQLRQNAPAALAEYDLTPTQRASLCRLQKRPYKTPHRRLPPRRHNFSLN